MKKLYFIFIFLVAQTFMHCQGIYYNAIVSVTINPINGTNDLEVVVRTQCTEVHNFVNYTFNPQTNALNICYRNTGLTMQTAINSTFILPNTNLSGNQIITINPYIYWWNQATDCSANGTFAPPTSINFDGPLVQQRVFTLDSNSFLKSQISLYPNPTNGVFRIDLPNEVNNVQVTINDLSGKNLYTIANYNSGNLLDVKGLAKGIYLVKVNYQQTSETIKFAIK